MKRRIQLDDGESTEQILYGVKQVIVINFRILSKYPTLRPRIGLRGATLNLISQCVLALVRVRQIGVVEYDHHGGQCHANKQQRHGKAIQTDAAGFAGDDFVVLAHHAQRHEYRHKRSKRGELIGEIRREIAEVLYDDKKWNSVAGDVVEKLEESERLEQKNERHHQEQEVREEPAQNVQIHEPRKAVALLVLHFDFAISVLRARGCHFARTCRFAAAK